VIRQPPSTRTGLGEQLAPHHLAAQHRFDPALALVVVAGLGDRQRHPAGDAHVGTFYVLELLLDHQLLQHTRTATPRFRPVRHQIPGVDQEVTLLLCRQGLTRGDGVAGGLAVLLGLVGQRERGAVRLAAALAVDDVDQGLGAVSHHRRQRAGPPQVHVRVVLPREPDAAVQLNVVLRVEYLSSDGVRRRDGACEPGAVEVVCPRGVPGSRRGLLGVDEHVRGVVLDGLEGADGAAELLADLRVLHGHVQCGPTDSDGLGGGQDAEDGAGASRGAAQHALLGDGDVAQCDRSDAAGGVQRRQRGHRDAVGIGVDQHDVVSGHDRQHGRIRSAQHGRALTGDHQVRADGDAARQAKRAHHTAIGESRKKLRANRIGRAAVDHHRGRHGGQEGAGAQLTALCLQHHRQLGQAEARTTVFLGDGKALPPDVGGGRPQGGRVVGALGVRVECGPGRSKAVQPFELAVCGVGEVAVVVGDR
jgi:hypothetical protein